VRKALALASARLGLKWSDWSGETPVHRLHEPVLLVGGERDKISRPEDINTLARAASPGSRSLLIPEANHEAVGFWFHELAEPVKAWFDDHLEAVSEIQSK